MSNIDKTFICNTGGLILSKSARAHFIGPCGVLCRSIREVAETLDCQHYWESMGPCLLHDESFCVWDSTLDLDLLIRFKDNKAERLKLKCFCLTGIVLKWHIT